MLDIKVSRTIHKPIDEVWRFVIDEFTEGHRWAYGTNMCRPGTADEPFDRVCETESGRLEDTITRVDDENHILEFTVEGLPFFVRSVVATWSLRSDGADATEITIGPRIETMPVVGHVAEIPMKKALMKLYPGLLDDMAIYVETGAPSARKQAELAQQS